MIQWLWISENVFLKEIAHNFKKIYMVVFFVFKSVYLDINISKTNFRNIDIYCYKLSISIREFEKFWQIIDIDMGSGWSKQKSENSGLFRNFLNAFWLSYPHPHSIGPFLCRKFSLIILCILLFARVHFRITCIYEKDLQKKKVNTGETRIFRQHKFIAFRYLNVYYKKAKPKLKSL